MERLISIIACLLLAVPCMAEIITVDDDGPADFNNIQAAINDSNDGDIIEVKPGTYTGDGNKNIDFGGRAITVRSENGPDSCIMDCEGLGCGFIFNQQEDGNSIVDGFTIVHGCHWCGYDEFPITWYGAGIVCEASSPTISNCVIRYNYAHFGAGICVEYGGSPTIFNCIIANNNGGGIFCGEGTWVINCTIVGNFGSVGGSGIICEGQVIIINSILWDNTPEQIEVLGYTPLVIYNDVQGGWPGNMDLNPLFADVASGDFHLKSQRGRWDVTNQIWVQDSVTSPCIDAGEPEGAFLDYTMELWPHGKHTNMGAYGGTAQASMSLSETGNIADLNNDDLVNYADMMLFTEKWLWEKVLLHEDLDRGGAVNFMDFSIFADNWLAHRTYTVTFTSIIDTQGDPINVTITFTRDDGTDVTTDGSTPIELPPAIYDITIDCADENVAITLNDVELTGNCDVQVTMDENANPSHNFELYVDDIFLKDSAIEVTGITATSYTITIRYTDDQLYAAGIMDELYASLWRYADGQWTQVPAANTTFFPAENMITAIIIE